MPPCYNAAATKYHFSYGTEDHLLLVVGIGSYISYLWSSSLCVQSLCAFRYDGTARHDGTT